MAIHNGISLLKLLGGDLDPRLIGSRHHLILLSQLLLESSIATKVTFDDLWVRARIFFNEGPFGVGDAHNTAPGAHPLLVGGAIGNL